MLVELIRVCPEVGIRYIELPLIGKAAVEESTSRDWMIRFLNKMAKLVAQQGVYLLLEVSIPPEKIVEFLKQIPSDHIQINYDTGNSAYWEFSPEDEISAYGHRIGNIHIKDCTRKITVFLLVKEMLILTKPFNC